MHKSRLAGFIIDCDTSDLQGAARFWGDALGMAIQRLPPSEGEKYVRLVDPDERLHIEVQAVTHPSRVHLDIESDDVEAEVRRLEALGARPSGPDSYVVRDGGADRPALLRRASAVGRFCGRREPVELNFASPGQTAFQGEWS